jgi:hypothetical protein
MRLERDDPGKAGIDSKVWNGDDDKDAGLWILSPSARSEERSLGGKTAKQIRQPTGGG